MSGPPPNAVTERLILTVNGGVDDWKEQLKNLLLTLKKQPGYMRTRWGPWEENMQKLDLLIGWASPEANETWKKSQDFADSIAQMKTVSSGEAENYFIKFVPLAPKGTIDSPVVEVVTIKNCSANEDELRATFEKSKSVPGANGCASGYSTTDVNGGGRVFVGAIGWQSVDASKGADKSSYVPAGAGEIEVHHVNFLFPIKGFSVTNTD